MAVCGAVGSGKSSLLSAILGHMKIDQGRVSVDGSFAYVSQQAWIMNSSLRDNILFGEAFDPKRYHSISHQCYAMKSLINASIFALFVGIQSGITTSFQLVLSVKIWTYYLQEMTRKLAREASIFLADNDRESPWREHFMLTGREISLFLNNIIFQKSDKWKKLYAETSICWMTR